jgi:hypothetical protein
LVQSKSEAQEREAQLQRKAEEVAGLQAQSRSLLSSGQVKVERMQVAAPSAQSARAS